VGVVVGYQTRLGKLSTVVIQVTKYCVNSIICTGEKWQSDSVYRHKVTMHEQLVAGTTFPLHIVRISAGREWFLKSPTPFSVSAMACTTLPHFFQHHETHQPNCFPPPTLLVCVQTCHLVGLMEGKIKLSTAHHRQEKTGQRHTLTFRDPVGKSVYAVNQIRPPRCQIATRR
jgi:hypothetical protein